MICQNTLECASEKPPFGGRCSPNTLPFSCIPTRKDTHSPECEAQQRGKSKVVGARGVLGLGLIKGSVGLRFGHHLIVILVKLLGDPLCLYGSICIHYVPPLHFFFISSLIGKHDGSNTTETTIRPSDGHVVHLCIIASIVTVHFTDPCHLWVVSVKHFWLSEVRHSPLQTAYLLFLVEVGGLEA